MNKISIVRYLYFLSVYLVMATIFGLSFTWNLTPGVVLTSTTIISLWYFYSSKRKTNYKAKLAIITLGLWYFYAILNSGSNLIMQLTINSLNFIIVMCIVFLGNAEKQRLLNFITRLTSVILSISLVAWILFLVDVPLPHSALMMHDDNYHSYINYYFFLLSPRNYFVLPRFLSVFKEPGHLASICVLLILANIKSTKEKRFDIIVLSIALFLSFSLAGWIVMLMALLLLPYAKDKHKIIYVMGGLVLFTGLYYMGVSNENSVVNEYIYSRLEYDENTGIIGNNRTNDIFESYYKKYINTPDVWFGIHEDLRGEYDWTQGCAGWKVTIVHSGYVGFLLINIILLVYFFIYKSKYGLIFLFSYLLLCYIRAYFTNPFWLYIFIIAIPLLCEKTTMSSNIRKKD